MLLYSMGFLVVALLAALLGLYQVASWAVGIACAILVITFFAGSAMTLWQVDMKRRAPPIA